MDIFDLNKKITLTSREREVLSLVSVGLSSKEVAVKLLIKKRTIDKHINNICLKFNAQNRTEAVVIAIKNKQI